MSSNLYKSHIAFILCTLVVASASFAEDICDQERGPFLQKVQKFNGTEEKMKDILTEYHYRRQFVYEACSEKKISEFEKGFAKVKAETANEFPRTSLTDLYSPRKTVEIGEIPSWRAPASNTNK